MTIFLLFLVKNDFLCKLLIKIMKLIGARVYASIWVKGQRKSRKFTMPYQKRRQYFFSIYSMVPYQVRTNIAECPLGFFSLCFLRPLKTPCEVQQLETLVVPCVLVRTWFCNLVNSAPVPISTYNLSQATNEYFPSNVSWVNFKSLENKKDTKV